jgi:hypothetical protein
MEVYRMQNNHEAKSNQEETETIEVPSQEQIANWWYSKLIIPIGIFEKILEIGGKNAGALWILYTRYIETGRYQGTNSAYATNSYMAAGLQWDIKKVKKYKKILLQHGLIKTGQSRTKKGKFEDTYIIPCGIVAIPDKSDNRWSDFRATRKKGRGQNRPTNALNNNIKNTDLKNKTAVRIIQQKGIAKNVVNEWIPKIGEGNVIDLVEAIENYAEKEKVDNATGLFVTLAKIKQEKLLGEQPGESK